MVGFNPWRVKTGRSVGGDIKPHEVTPVTKILRVQYMVVFNTEATSTFKETDRYQYGYYNIR